MWRNSEDYESLEPQLMQVVDAHVMKHEAYLQAVQQPTQEEKTPVADLVGDLSPEEQQFLEQNPQAMDDYSSGGGQGGEM